jgi:hypothetical protein
MSLTLMWVASTVGYGKSRQYLFEYDRTKDSYLTHIFEMTLDFLDSVLDSLEFVSDQLTSSQNKCLRASKEQVLGVGKLSCVS